MLKYERIVKRLSTAEKIRILTDIKALEDENIARLGVPRLNVTYLKHLLRHGYPMPSAISHSWDRELVREVAGSACNSLSNGEAELIVTPGPKVKLSPYRNELSEDPYLASEIAAEFAAGVKRTGVSGIMSGYYLTDTDAEMMDKKPSGRVLGEFLVNPYAEAMKKSGTPAVMADMRAVFGDYASVNSLLRSELSENAGLNGECVIFADSVEANDTVRFIVNGGICLRGSAVALETALNKYQKLKKSLESGELTVTDVETEIREGRAISPEIIDGAIDRLVDIAKESVKNTDYEAEDIDTELYFAAEKESARMRRREFRQRLYGKLKAAKAKAIAKLFGKTDTEDEAPEAEEEKAEEQITVTPTDKLHERAATRSVVLLRNEKDVAPIKKGAAVAIIGGVADAYTDGEKTLAERCADILTESGSTCIRASGYSLGSDRIAANSQIIDAMSAAGRAGVVLLFLGHGEQRGKEIPRTHKLSLPANQLLLADKLSKFGNRVIAVIESGYGVDIGFTKMFAGAVMAPFGCRYDAEAIMNVLLGRVNPSGRLAYTLYSSFDSYAPKHAVYRDKWNVKSGPFIGYRYYDTADLKVGYPFGHGLSYAEVVYSDIAVNGNDVSFILTNKSDMRIREVAQVYVGARESDVLRPKKELCGFRAVELGPKEQKRIAIEIDIPKVYDSGISRLVEESGQYDVYVGRSSEDVCLQTALRGGSRKVTPDKQLRVDYMLSDSNIIIDQYTLEAGYTVMKKSVKNIVSGIVSILLAISLGIYYSTVPSGAFIGIMAGILAVAGVFFFIADVKERNSLYRDERVIIDRVNNERFADAEELPEFSAKSMFRDEFDVIETDNDQRAVMFRNDRASDESLKYVDKDLDFVKASSEFAAFAMDRGVQLKDTEAEKIFAALAASRLVIFKDMKSDSFRSLVAVLSEYFETNPYIDTVDSSYTNEESALFLASGENSKAKRSLAYAIEAANNVSFNVHIAALDNVKCENLLNYFAPYVKHAKNPFGYTALVAHNEWDKETTYYLPQNIWFFINLADGEGYDDIPDYIADIASVNTVSPVKCKAQGAHVIPKKFRYYQFDYLLERAANTHGILEDTWKKIDRIVAYVATHSDFHIENKLCLAFEKYAAALMASGVEIPAATDMAMAAKLLPSLVVAAAGRIPEDERSLEETFETVFGSDVIDESMALIKEAQDSVNRKQAQLLAKKEAEKAKAAQTAASNTEAVPTEAEELIPVTPEDTVAVNEENGVIVESSDVSAE